MKAEREARAPSPASMITVIAMPSAMAFAKIAHNTRNPFTEVT